MNYHNSASRLSLPRRSPIPQIKVPPKSARKNARRPTIRRPLSTAVAAAILAFLFLHAGAAAQADAVLVNPPPRFHVNTPTLIVTVTGLAVALLRLPGLWRRDFVS